MKKILNVHDYSNTTSLALLTARVGISVLMLTHGIPKLMMLFSGSPIQFPSVFGMSPELSLGLTVFAEVFCSILIVAGLATRLATVPLLITMLVAATIIHAADPFAAKELALMYLLAYIVLLFAGSGKYSIDFLLSRKNMAVTYANRKVQDPRATVYQ